MGLDNKGLSTLQDLNVTLEKPSTDFPLFLVILFRLRLPLHRWLLTNPRKEGTHIPTHTDLHERVFPASCGRYYREPVIRRLPSMRCSCSRSTGYPAVEWGWPWSLIPCSQVALLQNMLYETVNFQFLRRLWSVQIWWSRKRCPTFKMFKNRLKRYYIRQFLIYNHLKKVFA
jgi:hypothetical protein